MLRLGRAPAKLNLVLELTRRRADGYHELAAVSHTIDWSDLVGVEMEDSARPDYCRLVVVGPRAGDVPHDGQNILLRALDAMREAGFNPPITRLVLDKRIPAKSGLGGGSADAAALLRMALGRTTEERVLALAKQCGADVPFAIGGGAALLTGIGEVLEPLRPISQGVFLVAHLGDVSTAAAYAAVEPRDFSDGRRAESVARALRAGLSPDPKDLGSALLPAALRVTPGLAEQLRALRGATPWLDWAMTGSGGTFFSLVMTPELLARSAAALARLCPEVPFRAVAPEAGCRQET